jgi:hypothetical protein
MYLQCAICEFVLEQVLVNKQQVYYSATGGMNVPLKLSPQVLF